MKVFFAIALLFSLAGASSAQQPAPAQGAAVTGLVLRAADGSPLRNARLELASMSDQNLILRARSDARGAFQISRIPAGHYRLQVKCLGFAPQTYKSALILLADSRLKGVTFRLQPEGVVTGKVVDEQGEPRPGVEVRAVGRAASSSYARSAVTNDLGEYRLYGLAAGEYFLVAIDSGNPYLTDYDVRGGADTEGADREYPPTYYPGTPSRSQASTIKLAPGEELHIDFKLLHTRMAHLSGRVVLRDGRPAAGAEVALEPVTAERAFSLQRILGRSDAHGHFAIARVPPGRYELTASAKAGMSQLSARQPIEVGTAPLRDLAVVVAPPQTLRGRVNLTGGRSLAEGSQVMLWLRNRDGEDAGFGSAEVQPDGAFTVIPELPEGTYDLTLTGAPDAVYLRSAYFGTQDALQNGVTISNQVSPVPLLLTLDPQAAQVVGILEDDSGPYPGAQLKLLRIGDGPQPDAVADSITDGLGVFQFPGLAPGEYQIVAEGNSDYTEENSTRAVATVTVVEDERKTLHLNLNQP